jgi:hypothetical protein
MILRLFKKRKGKKGKTVENLEKPRFYEKIKVIEYRIVA